MRVSIIVVNWNGGSVLAACLRSLCAQTYEDREILVFDNGSTDGSVDGIERAFPGVRLLRASDNLGFAEANNRAIEAASGELIALVNNDATLDPAWTAAMVSALRAAPQAGAAAGRTLQAGDPQRVDSAGFALYLCGTTSCWRDADSQALAAPDHAPFGPVASAAMYRRSALQTVGLFHPEYFCYYEDTDLAARLVLWGYSTLYVPEAVAYHVGSHTGQEQSDFHVYHLRRNVEYLYWVDMVGQLAWTNLPTHLAYETLALLGAARKGQLQVVLSAKRDALAHAAWIVRRRRDLKARLQAEGRLREAQHDMRRKARPGVPWMTRAREALQRMRAARAK